MSLAIGVLLSGGGTNLQAVIDRIEQGTLDAEIRLVLSDQPGAGGLQRAESHGLPTGALPRKEHGDRREHDRAMVHRLREAGVEAVLLAGYMRIVSGDFVQAFPRGILNIHPSLLPAFPGLNAQQQAADYGVRIAGASVHFVDEYMDHGPLVIQAALPVPQEAGAEDLTSRILRLEHRIYPQAVQWLAEDRLRVQQGRVVLERADRQPADTRDLAPCLVQPPLERGF
jgi:phosphoribosylglycinamide formyltransferase-1